MSASHAPALPPEYFDLIIIGAGIHGAAIAREAAARGLRTLVLEQADRAATATSSRSSKLIHGGLRYLETAQLALVRECLREQKILLRTAPHLVQRARFHIPLWSNTRRAPWLIALGLHLYWLLGAERPRVLPLNSDAGLQTQNLRHLFAYQDAQTDDVELTKAVMESALRMGAQCCFASPVIALQKKDDGYALQTQSLQGRRHYQARVVVNASGPWINQLAALAPDLPQLPIELIRGSHIELPGALEHCTYLEADDGRALFVLPWRGHRLIGTTEVLHQGAIENCQPSATEIEYLLANYNRCFAQTRQRSELIAAWSGLRVLPISSTAAFARQRDAVLLCDNEVAPTYLAVYGGKLTSHRATAQQVMRKLARRLPAAARAKIDTARQYLPLLNH